MKKKIEVEVCDICEREMNELEKTGMEDYARGLEEIAGEEKECEK